MLYVAVILFVIVEDKYTVEKDAETYLNAIVLEEQGKHLMVEKARYSIDYFKGGRVS